jgi:hypothetical protein
MDFASVDLNDYAGLSSGICAALPVVSNSDLAVFSIQELSSADNPRPRRCREPGGIIRPKYSV